MESMLQFRTIPLYNVPSLQGLCREVIFQHMKRKDGHLTAANIEKLEIPKTLIQKLTLHEQNNSPPLKIAIFMLMKAQTVTVN
ncbi:hypothetical protein EAI_09362 [Harpegnathos saltator]|uniref:SOCS box domain-containing protein n=2 Tax=Harpegnathos saltator TaxID=610380 RepID=E2BCK3_HARSA|nr:hypothetical protein EAI_09362 [Harpegnathos saltator]